MSYYLAEGDESDPCRVLLWHPDLFRTVLLAIVLAALPVTLWAGSIKVNSAESTIINQMVVINAQIEFEFSDDAQDAMRSGIALYIDVDFRIKRKRPYIWDPQVVALSRRYRIERHALTDRYVITDLVTDDRRLYDSLSEAIRNLGNIREIPIAEQSILDATIDYRIGLRARLDLASLPAPIRPIAYISPSWRMSSRWYQWIFTQ